MLSYTTHTKVIYMYMIKVPTLIAKYIFMNLSKQDNDFTLWLPTLIGNQQLGRKLGQGKGIGYKARAIFI